MHNVPATRIGYLREKIATLNKRAAKLGCEPISLTIGSMFTRTYKHEITGVDYQRSYYPVDVRGVAPKLSGFIFVAKIEPYEAGNIVKCLPDETAPEWAWTTDMDCDHCGLKRRRNEIFIVRNVESGELVRVGRTCLADYLGGSSPETIARRAEMDIELRSLLDDDGSQPPEEDTVIFIATCQAVARELGFVTRKMLDADPYLGETTAERAWWIVTSSKYYKEFVEYHPNFNMSEADVSLAQEAMAWALQTTDQSEYFRNLRVAVANSTVDSRSKGIAASVLAVYAKTLNTPKDNEPRKESQWLGSVGEKITAKITVSSVNYLSGDYGTTTVINMIDADGNVIVWFASGSHDVNKDEQYKVSGKIKKLDEYRSVKQTILTRCTLIA